MRGWLRTHTSTLVTATGAVLVLALVITAAVVSTGYSAQRMNLNDASVWVVNSAKQYVGRANTEVFELNSVVESASPDIAVVQSGATVLLVDTAQATLDIVDPATSTVRESVALPPLQPQVYLVAQSAIVYEQGTGELWVVPAAELSSFDAQQLPTLNLGAGSLLSVEPSGIVFGFSPDAEQVYRMDVAAASIVQQTSATHFASPRGDFELSSVGGAWAVLDRTTSVLETSSGPVDLSATIAPGSGPRLQSAAASGQELLIGYSGGLLALRFGAGITQLATGHSGTAAPPSTVGGCAFAAWSDGSAWRRCAGEAATGVQLQLDAMPSGSQLLFAENGDRVILNDARSGASWAVQARGQLIDNWDDLISVLENTQQVDRNDDTTPPQTEQAQVPPVAVDDALGARPGRATPLAVLLNDYDANGDVLVITAVDQPDPALGRIDIVGNRQSLQVTLTAAATGQFAVDYTISDGRGGTATATLTLTVRAEAENSPPVQVRSSSTNVVSGGQVTLDVLGDWVDPDGDPFFLSLATVAPPDTASYRADGQVTFSDKGAGTSTKLVALTVSDGRALGSGVLSVQVSAQGAAPIITEPFVVLAYAGVEVRISPLDHVRGGNGRVRLSSVPQKSGVTLTSNLERGTFRFTSDQVGTHYLEYVVTDDIKTVTGVVRVDVAAPPDADTVPIAVPKTVFIHSLGSETVDVASTDIDPAGGVLLVTGVMNVPALSGVRAEIIEQRSVRITLQKPLGAPTSFNYRVTNGLAEAQGTITVIEIPAPERLQPPIARDDVATVRVGDAITIPVMANDEHPDGASIRLNPVLVSGLDGDSGLLFASGNTLRYLAPDHTGNFTATYEILGPLGQSAQAQLSIQVREPNLETNHAPAPSRIDARVLAGQVVRIDIPLSGIDPDGDSVQLLGQETNPEKGAVTEVGSNYILYEAGPYSAGTDSFTYTLIDALGARATGTVRVGISPRLEGARNPVAVDDEVRARPGSTVSVRVLENDSDPDGSPLTVTSVVAADAGVTAQIVESTIVRITVPTAVASYGLTYTITNKYGGTSTNFITVIVSNDAPLAYPIASDTVLTLSDILDHNTINVAVLDHVFFADGEASSLDVSLVPGYSGASVQPDKTIRVTVGNERQIIPFAVAHPRDPAVRSYAFIWVPGYNDALPQVDPRAPSLTVRSEDTLTIDLNDYVIAVGGKSVQLTDTSTVAATHSNGASLVVDKDTLRFTSADLYFGPASISFEVTDGASASDPSGRTAILVLPITVTPRENQAPDFIGAVLDFEPGQQKTLNLVELTNYPYAADRNELTYSVITPAEGFSYDLRGQQLVITADTDAVKNTASSLTLGVRDAVTTGNPGRIELTVVPSTRPLARPAADNATTRRGQQTVIDVLANDQPTNPFPGEPLTVVQVTGADGASLPSGVSVEISQANSRLTVTVGASAEPVDVTMQYQVADATRDPDRYVWGTVRISIQDVPDTPAKPTRQASSFTPGELTLRLTQPQPNNSPITNYRVLSSSHGDYSHDCGTSVVCSIPGLSVGELYTFQVVATNAIGDSAASALSDAYSIDYLPAAPASVSAAPDTTAPAGGAISVNWSAVPDPSPGTAVVGYTVLVNGSQAAQTGAGVTSATVTGLANDVVYSVEVYARNSAQVVSSADWNRTGTSVHTVGPPSAPSPAPQATSGSNGAITVTWGASSANGGSTVTFAVARVSGAGSASDCTSVAPMASGVTSPWTDSSAVDGASYTYLVYASNGPYCTPSQSAETVSLTAPGAATGSASVEDRGSGQFDIRAGAVSASGTVQKYQYQLSTDGTWRDVPGDGWLTTLGSPGAAYGQPIDVSYRACRTASDAYCGAPSSATTLTPVNARVTSASCSTSAPSPNPPTIGQPANSGAVTASYQVSYNRPIVAGTDNWSAYGSSTSDVPADATGIRVRATVNGYADPGYGEFPCTP